jgi:hypothetical protein
MASSAVEPPSGLTVRERSRLSLLAALRCERWAGVVSESEAERVVRRRRVLVERSVRGGGLLVHAGGCVGEGGLCDPGAGCGVMPLCDVCALRVVGVVA